MMQRCPLPRRCIEKFLQALVEVPPRIRFDRIGAPFAKNLREAIRDRRAAVAMPIRRYQNPAIRPQNP
jgi:hypothetical protein